MNLEELRAHLAPWSLDDEHRFVTPNGKATGVKLAKKGLRFAAHTESGAQLWSGPDPKHFITRFWNYSYPKDPTP